MFVLVVAAGAAVPQAQGPVARTTTTGVVIDVTVVDKNGQPVTDLRPDEFDLIEDGVRQQISSVTFVRAGIGQARTVRAPSPQANSGAPAPTAGTATPVPADSSVMPSVTAILFDRLSADMRPLAGRAALAYVATLTPPRDYVGVFLADIALKTFHPFTSDQSALRSAVDRVMSTAPSNLTAKAEPFGSSRIQGLDPNTAPTVGAESAGGYINALEREKRLTTAAGGDPSVKLTQMELRMTESYHQFLAESEGQSSLAGLRAVVKGLSALPGRKSVLYFTEALPITDRLKPRFDALIGEANRANVTVFAVDAAGLRVHSTEAALGRNVNLAGTQVIGDARRPDGPYTKELERQEQLLSSRPTAVLGRLAKETGGFLLENTNDLGAGVARMQQERTTYYLLTYEPANAAMDGKFRRVTVKVKRPKVTVKGRPGYLAGSVQDR
ncbi:MAG: VWA domain-containing protein [Acidobacteriota bacterium]